MVNGRGTGSCLRVMDSEKPKSRSRTLQKWFKRKHKGAEEPPNNLSEFSGLLFLLLYSSPWVPSFYYYYCLLFYRRG